MRNIFSNSSTAPTLKFQVIIAGKKIKKIAGKKIKKKKVRKVSITTFLGKNFKQRLTEHHIYID